MNRAERRRIGMRVVNDQLKLREQSVAKKQWGIGFVLTTHMLAITFLRWTWIPWDRRLK